MRRLNKNAFSPLCTKSKSCCTMALKKWVEEPENGSIQSCSSMTIIANLDIHEVSPWNNWLSAPSMSILKINGVIWAYFASSKMVCGEMLFTVICFSWLSTDACVRNPQSDKPGSINLKVPSIFEMAPWKLVFYRHNWLSWFQAIANCLYLAQSHTHRHWDTYFEMPTDAPILAPASMIKDWRTADCSWWYWSSFCPCTHWDMS